MKNKETIVFGGGCFWCTEAIFKELRGVRSVIPGYAGGSMKNPTYEDVSSRQTGHAEVIKVDFDPKVIPFVDLLDIFFHLHDPTTQNRQGADIGSQYRSIILYGNTSQKSDIKAFIERLKQSGEFKRPIVTEVIPLVSFYGAEEYHKDYFKKNSYLPYCQLIISPKLQHLREKYSAKIND